jgi:hypothetical protein
MAWRSSDYVHEYLKLRDELTAEFHEEQPLPPESLYHYTDVGGLKGIVETHSIWATHARCLNDPTEVQHTQRLLTDAIASVKATSKLGDRLLKECARYLGPEMVDYYVASFSEKGDLLSQWRGYADEGRGYVLAFSTMPMINRQIQIRGGTQAVLRKVVYDRGKQDAFIDSVLQSTIDLLETHADELPAKGGPDLELGYAQKFVQELAWECYPVYKRGCFEEECEWRLVLPRWQILDYHRIESDPWVRWRTRGSLLVPYCELRMPEQIDEEKKPQLPLTQVGLGPLLTGGAERESIRLFLAAHGYPQELSVSGIPLR